MADSEAVRGHEANRPSSAAERWRHAVRRTALCTAAGALLGGILGIGLRMLPFVLLAAGAAVGARLGSLGVERKQTLSDRPLFAGMWFTCIAGAVVGAVAELVIWVGVVITTQGPWGLAQALSGALPVRPAPGTMWIAGLLMGALVGVLVAAGRLTSTVNDR